MTKRIEIGPNDNFKIITEEIVELHELKSKEEIEMTIKCLVWWFDDNAVRYKGSEKEAKKYLEKYYNLRKKLDDLEKNQADVVILEPDNEIRNEDEKI